MSKVITDYLKRPWPLLCLPRNHLLCLLQKLLLRLSELNPMFKPQEEYTLMRKNPQTKTTKAFQYNVCLVLIILFQWNNLERKKRSCQASWFKNFPWPHYSKEKDSVFCIFCIRHKGKLTAEHIWRKLISRRGEIIGRKLLKHLLITNNLKQCLSVVMYWKWR